MSIQGFNVHGQEAAYGYPYLDNKPVIDDALSDSSTNAVENRVVKAAIDGKAGEVIGTASGSIASFPDGADDVPVKALSCAINPVQDLHGLSNPFPYGATKNVIDNRDLATLKANNTDGTWSGNKYTLNGVTFTVNGDGTYTASGTASAQTSFYIYGSASASEALLPASTEYIVSGAIGTGKYIIVNGYASSNVTQITTEQTFTTKSTAANGKIILRVNNGTDSSGTFKPMIRLSSVADSTFVAGSNICPITGFTGANVTRTGKNLLDQSSNIAGSIVKSNGEELTGQDQNYGRTVFIRVSPNTAYTWSGLENVISIVGKRGGEYASADFSSFVRSIDGASNESGTFTTSASTNYVCLNVVIAGTSQQIELGSSASSYEAYNGNTYAISWNTEAGTVYGGSLDVTTGVLTVTHKSVNLTDQSWSKYTDSQSEKYSFYFSLTDARIADTGDDDCICSSYNAVPTMARLTFVRTQGVDGQVCHVGGGKAFYFINNNYSDKDLFAASLTGQTLVYELATPIEVILTSTQISTLLGANNIWHDANGNTSVTYVADTTLFMADKYAALPAIPEAPNADGTYRLKATVSGGTATYTWESV